VGENIDTIQKNTKALLHASKEVGMEVNPEKIKYLLVSGGRTEHKGRKRSFEVVQKFKYLGTLKIKIACMKRLRAD
jgi:hypothetical protein